jgi:uncharacterized SAM-binding protein YcdF (DUF218 family)/glycosyltransferase involved in cell wall biosynthesis
VSDPAPPAPPARRDIVCLSTIDWDFIWQTHQELMSAFAEQGSRVLFIENTGVRSPRLRDMPRMMSRLRNWWRGTQGFRREGPNLFVLSPLVIPLPYSRIARVVNRALIGRAVRRWMKAAGFRRPIVWTFLATPIVHDVVVTIDPELVVYHCLDDFASSSREARRIATSEARLFRQADVVFVSSEKLRQRALQYRAAVHVVRAGVNVAQFEAVRDSNGSVPPDLQLLKRPIVGYIGGIHQWFDQQLVIRVAGQMPEATFALVGPAQSDVAELERVPNVRLLGVKSHAELPAYVKAFDVGIVPYRLSEYTANVYPVKLNEYLVMGVPVVATPLHEIERFNRDHGDVVAVAADSEAFAAATRIAAARRHTHEADERIEVARRNSWASRIKMMSAIVDAALAEREAAPRRWEEKLRTLYRRGRLRTAKIAGGFLACYLLLFYTPLVWWVGAPLRVEAPPTRADVAVVFAGGVGESGQAGGGYQERVKRAVDLYRAGDVSQLMFSSGYVFAFREAEIMQSLAVDFGVPAAAIVLESEATNTYENVVNTARLLRSRKWHRILLVSSPYHMRRAVLTWHKVAPDIDVIPTPPQSSQFYAHDTGANLQQLRGIVHEYGAIVLYRWRGWI